jgi:hypothetical protein
MNPKLTLALLAIGLSVPAFAAAASDTDPTAHILGGGGKGPAGPGPSTPGGDFGVVDEWDEREDTLLDQAIKLLEVAETAPTVADLKEAIKDLSIAEDMEEQEIHPRESKEPKGPRGSAGPRKPTSSRPRHAKEDHDEIIKQEKSAIILIQEAVNALQTNNRKKTTDNVSAALVAIKRADVLNEDEDPNEGTESVKGARAAASASGATAPAKPRKK